MAIDLSNILAKYRGLWVGLTDDEQTVIASGKTVAEVMDQAKKQGHEQPILFRVPSDLLPYVGFQR